MVKKEINNCKGLLSLYDETETNIPMREWRTEHCLNCTNMRRDYARDPWGNPGNVYCKAYEDYLGRGVWMFVLKVGCKVFKRDPRKDFKL